MSKYFYTSYLKETSIIKNFNEHNFIKYINFCLFLCGLLYIDFYYKNKEIIEMSKIHNDPKNNDNKLNNQINNNNYTTTTNTKNKSIILTFLSPIDEEDVTNFIKDMKKETDSINKNITINVNKNKFNISTNIIISDVRNDEELKFILDKIHHDENILIEII
jgi:hypothetical protein